MNTAKQNIETLPEWCWAILPIDKSLVRVKAGESGYYPLNVALTEDKKRVFDPDLTNDQIADKLNAERGISKAQRKAMEWGSMFGWETPLANPDNYNKEGIPYSEKNPRPVAKKVSKR